MVNTKLVEAMNVASVEGECFMKTFHLFSACSVFQFTVRCFFRLNELISLFCSDFTFSHSSIATQNQFKSQSHLIHSIDSSLSLYHHPNQLINLFCLSRWILVLIH